tara:strand:- start:863 stop:1603 length:741 start_codon:yes stop_codon:yes gene_type:complete
MIHSGRHRIKTHGGLPQGSTCNLAAKLEIYLMWNTGEGATSWRDVSPNVNNAAQTSAPNQPTAVAGGGLDFEDTGSVDDSSWMDFSSFNVPVNTNFLSFIVCKIEDAIATSCYLSDSGAEVFQFTAGNIHQFKTMQGLLNMNHSTVFTVSEDEKVVFMIHRTNDSTGTVRLYKNGLLCDGDGDSGSVQPGNFDLQNLGNKNDSTNFFDGIIYDVGFVNGDTATDKVRDMITDYLCTKHGIEREGHY